MIYHAEFENGENRIVEAPSKEEATKKALEQAVQMKTKLMLVR